MLDLMRAAAGACALAVLLAVIIGIPVACAAPPPAGSDDWKLMMPYKEWITSQHDRMGRWCCDIGDGRPVDARIVGDEWQAHVTPEHWPGEKDRWMAVPAEKITRNANPTGTAILWLYQSRVQCFAPPDGV